jgi:hypothetical protein
MHPKYDPISPHLRVLTAERVLVQMKFTRAPIFEGMQKQFWFEHFSDLSFKQLAWNCKVLGLPNPHNNPYSIPKSELIAALVHYFQEKVS